MAMLAGLCTDVRVGPGLGRAMYVWLGLSTPTAIISRGRSLLGSSMVGGKNSELHTY